MVIVRSRGTGLYAITILLFVLIVTSPANSQPERWMGPHPFTEEAFGSFDFGVDFSKFRSEIEEGFSYLLRGLFFGTYQKPSDSPLNPDNYPFEIPTYGLTLGLRPDFSLNFRSLYLALKPRLYLDWQRCEEGPTKGKSETNSDVFVNEWIARLRIREGLLASYGRENIQWGPSFFISPSNPFFADNGQANPKQEIPGMDFARVLWIPSSSWTASLIANTGRGQQEFIGDFKPVYALKMDYTSFKKYASLIISRREGESLRVGAFAGGTISNALLLYGEGALFKGNELYYLKKDFGDEIPEISMLPDPEKSLETLFLLGGSYTFEAGPALTLEYLYNSAGFSDNDVDLFYRALKVLAGSPAYQYPFTNLTNPSDFISGKSLGPNFKVFRKNYLMLQYSHSQIKNLVDVLLRYTYSLDSDSSQLIAMATYSLGDHAQLFFIGNQNFGPKDGEFRALQDRSAMLGIEYTF